MQNYMSFLGFKVAIIGPCMNKNPFDKSDPNVYIISQRINLNSAENKAKLKLREEGKIFLHIH